jgi:predicted anti-sigma-YlaC factor YlaD
VNRGKCPEEAKVAAAVRAGECDALVAAHTAECPACREVLDTAKWMQALTLAAGEDGPLPDPGLLWQKARWAELLSAKQAKAERTRQALQWAELSLLAIAGAGLAVWAIGNGVSFQPMLSWLAVAFSPQVWVTAFSAAGAGSLAGWAVVGAACAAALLFTLRILAEG